MAVVDATKFWGGLLCHNKEREQGVRVLLLRSGMAQVVVLKGVIWPPQGTSGNVYRHFWLSQLQEGRLLLASGGRVQ